MAFGQIWCLINEILLVASRDDLLRSVGLCICLPPRYLPNYHVGPNFSYIRQPWKLENMFLFDLPNIWLVIMACVHHRSQIGMKRSPPRGRFFFLFFLGINITSHILEITQLVIVYKLNTINNSVSGREEEKGKLN